MNLLKGLLKDEKGQALSEYGLVLGIVVIGVIALLGTLRQNIVDMFTKITEAIKLK